MRCKYIRYAGGNIVPCGKCIACRVNHSVEWSIRLSLEAKQWQHVAFVTLTYSDEFLPNQLDKKALQLFFKRLRRNLDDRFIRYFSCGEYGDTTHRPHYHAIIFGLDAGNMADRQAVVDSWSFCDEFMFDMSRGNNSGIVPACASQMRYVAGYCTKKAAAYSVVKAYQEQGIQPPFQLSSLHLGEEVFEKDFDRYISIGGIPMYGKIRPIPAAWCRKYGIIYFHGVPFHVGRKVMDEYHLLKDDIFRRDELMTNEYFQILCRKRSDIVHHFFDDEYPGTSYYCDVQFALKQGKSVKDAVVYARFRQKERFQYELESSDKNKRGF